MEVIYGRDWPTSVVDLARYVAKHFGCRMSSDGYTVPASVVGFLDGSQLGSVALTSEFHPWADLRSGHVA
jgi:hypothetical protein